ncbi:MAG TPA: hypothetical protein VGJ53_19405 [Micromonosporaceae bacterium]|jgi:hypothetical protein
MPDPRRNIYARDPGVWDRATAYAEQTGQSVSQLVEAALRHYLTVVLPAHPDPAMRPRPQRPEMEER